MKNKIIFLFLLLFFPMCVHASEFALVCGKGPFKPDEVVNCQIKASKTYVYEEVSATIEGTNSLTCSMPVIGQGLEEVEVGDNNFKYKGQENTGVIVSFSCAVKNIKNDITDQLEISDFHYNIDGKESTEILRSNKIELKRLEVNEIIDTKPRDVSVKESLLSELSSPQLSFVFSSYLTKYEMEVLSDVNHIDFSAAPMVEGATYEIQGDVDLSEGLNIIDIYVTSPDGNHKTCYTFYVTKLKEGEDIYYPEKDSTLKTLKIKGKSIGFQVDKYEYKVHLYSDENSIEVETEANNKDATVNIDKTTGLKNGDIITVLVTSEDGINTTKYTIKVTKDAPKKNYTPIIVIGGIALAMICVFIGFVRTNNKKIAAPSYNKDINLNNLNQTPVNPNMQVNQQVPQQSQVVQPVDSQNNTNN